MRVRRDHHFTHFSDTGVAGSATVSMRRVFHPTRGEEVQLELEIQKKHNGAAASRTITTRASLTLTVAEAEEFTRTMRGGKDPMKVLAVGPIRSEASNEYTPPGYDKLTPRERALVRDAFEAGRCYEGSLVP